ncbi:unnamed protein product [Acidithrix sp. C25]|nr:unnamed protein product [Acidithrix sp. C25]
MRIRILELLTQESMTVSALMAEIGAEASHLSQQLGVLRRAGLIVSEKSGSTVTYSIVHPEVGDLLKVARHILTEVLTNATSLLKDLQQS